VGKSFASRDHDVIKRDVSSWSLPDQVQSLPGTNQRFHLAAVYPHHSIKKIIKNSSCSVGCGERIMRLLQNPCFGSRLMFILITLITNVIICAVLLAPNMRSPTNVLLVAIATSDALTPDCRHILWVVPSLFSFRQKLNRTVVVCCWLIHLVWYLCVCTMSLYRILLVTVATSDALTGVWSLPVSVYLFWLGAYRDWLPHSWCFIYFCLMVYLPTVFHTASIWLTTTRWSKKLVRLVSALTVLRNSFTVTQNSEFAVMR